MLSFLGIGGAFATDLKNCAAFYKESDYLLLIDCGENIFEEIIKKKLLDNIDKLYIIITHFHTDHIGSLGTLLFYCDKINISLIKIIYPNKNEIIKFLNMIGTEKCIYEVLIPDEFKEFSIKEVKQQHSIMEAYGYLININNKKIYYSGDTKTIPNEIIEKFYNDEIDYFYQDVRLDENDYHISLKELNNIVSFDKRYKVNCMHFNSYNEMNIVKQNGYKLVKKIR